MKKYNLDFIGTIVSSPDGKSSWGGTTIGFWGKFKEKQPYQYTRFERENLIEAIPLTEERPSKDYYRCLAFQRILEKYLFIEE